MSKYSRLGSRLAIFARDVLSSVCLIYIYNFKNTYTKIHLYFQFGPRILYPIWTTCWLMYHLGWISYDIYTKFEGDNNGDPVYFSKLTNWTFILLLLSNFIDAVTTLFAHCRTDISCDNQGKT